MPEYIGRYFKYDMVWNRPVTESVTGGMWITGGKNSIPITLTPPQLSASTRDVKILMMVTRTIKATSMWALAILGLVMVSLPLRKVSDWIEH